MEDPLKHLGLVAVIAKGYQGRGLEMDDLKQEGFLGLMTACERFDPRRNVPFGDHAAWWIKEAISGAIRSQARPVRIPHWVRTAINKGASPDDTSLKPSRRNCILAALRILNAERVDDELFPLLAAEETAADDDFAEVVAPRLAELGPRDRQIIDMRFGLDGSPAMSRDRIGEVFKLTRERIRQLETKALARLRTGA